LPLDFLEESALPAREVELSPQEIAELWVTTPGASERRHLLGRSRWSKAPPVAPASGPTTFPVHTRLGVRLEELSPDRLGRAISRVLGFAHGERLELSLEWSTKLETISVSVPPDVALETLEVRVRDLALDLSTLRVGAFKTPRLARPESLPAVDWGLELENAGALRLEQIAERAPGLRVLGASLERIEETALLARWPALERLRLVSPLWQEAQGVRLSNLSKLRSLTLAFSHISAGILAALAEGPARLERLGLQANGAVENRDRKLYRELGLLESLHWLQVDDVDSTSVKGWERLECLETLVLSCSPPSSLNPVAWRTVAGLSQLKTLATDSCGLGDFSIGVLAKNPSLERLELRQEHGLTDAGLRALEGHPRLKHVSLIDTRTTAAGMARLRSSLGPDAFVEF
jgi:hypothetical protein